MILNMTRRYGWTDKDRRKIASTILGSYDALKDDIEALTWGGGGAKVPGPGGCQRERDGPMTGNSPAT